MKTLHDMPFGAALEAHSTHFGLWAPSAASVELVLLTSDGDAAQRALPMTANGGGWFRTAVEGCGAGARYRYRVAREGEAPVDVPDPASRFNPEGVDGPSEVIDPTAFEWDADWRGRAWHDAVIYELHLGSFTAEGTYRAAEAKLQYLADTGVTAIELMPLATYAGAHGWGYDGVLLFAPHPAHGRPEELKHFIQAAHRLGLMVMLDVVYNHFGPAGNYLHHYAEPFFNANHQTPWGAAIGFDGAAAATVRDFYIHNALHWLEEYRFDGLRFDAVHAIRDDSARHILDELPRRVRAELDPAREVHLVLENEDNGSRWLGGAAARDAGRFEAQWNDDFHHVAHVLLTGETGGYYSDFTDAPVARLGRALAEGYVYQGEPSPHHGNQPRGEPSRTLPPEAFVDFLQNHDQIGNRPYGERLTLLAAPERLEAMTVLWLLAPAVPLLFMGEEFGATTPFRYFCDFEGELREAVTRGRRREVAGMLGIADPDAADPPIPDPCDVASLVDSRLDWAALESPAGAARHALYRRLLTLRRERLVPRMAALRAGAARHATFGAGGLQVAWPFADGSAWALQANLADTAATLPAVNGETVLTHGDIGPGPSGTARLGAWSVRWLLAPNGEALAWTPDT